MFLGFDIGGTKCAVIYSAGLEQGKPSIDVKKAIPTQRTPEAMIESLFAIAGEILADVGVTPGELAGIGISCGGPLSSRDGLILSPPNLPGWDRIPIVAMTEAHFGVKTLLQNDANAGAVAESRYGAGIGKRNMIFLTFGTGMGAGLILDGRLYSGTTDLAGEVGHIRLAEMGPVGFGKAGSFEGYCSGGGIAQLAQIKAREKLQVGERVGYCSSIDDLPSITTRDVAVSAKAGDPTALEVFRVAAFYLGRGLSMLIDVLNPELIVMGSIYGRSGDLLDPVMHSVIREEALADSYKDCEIVPAGLGEAIGDYAALTLAVMASEEKKVNA